MSMVVKCSSCGGSNQLPEGKKELEKLKPYNQNTYVLVEGKRVSFEKLAKEISINLKTFMHE